MHLINIGCSPLFWTTITSTFSMVSLRLRSASSRCYEKPATRLKLGERSLAFAGPAAWKSLLTSLHDITNDKAFKCKLKTVLFKWAFSAYCILTISLKSLLYKPMHHWLRYGVNGALKMTFMNQGCERDLHVRDRDETETFDIASETKPRRDVHQNFTRPRRDRDVRFFVQDETETSQKLSETRPRQSKTILVFT